MEGGMMPNLAPMNQPKKTLKGDWFQLVPNPDDPKDTGLCIQMLRGPFSHVILKYQNFKTKPELNVDGSLTCDYSYDILLAPNSIGEKDLTDEEGQIFEKMLGEILLELLWESAENENRNSNTKKSITK
jgi:hypothetical protein